MNHFERDTPPARILIVDDEPVIRFALKGHLSQEGYAVSTAEDYPSALEVISSRCPDVIIADIILGGNTGIDLLEKVKAAGLNCPVIMITGMPNLQTAMDSVRLGAFEYLGKPVKTEVLLQATRRALNFKSLMDENERYRRNLEAIFSSLKDAIITVDQQMQVLEANDATLNICGFAKKDLLGKRYDTIQTDCSKACLGILQQTLKTQTGIRDFHVDCGNRGPSHRVVLLTSSPLINHNQEFMGAILVIRDITRLNEMEQELKERHSFHKIIGKSPKMKALYRLLENLIDIDTTVLVTGESGTGKELVAHALHYEGHRADKPMISVNCSALNETLLESELFGHVRGAFTGAIKDRIGRFQMADGGTIFLDEIGDISPHVQLKLLRVLQEKTFERVGNAVTESVDVRVITATNKNLKKKVECGEFREDLYYRLKVVEVNIPPLRERKDDIPLLVAHLFEKLNNKLKKDIAGITDVVLALLLRYTWPGNIRELENALEHAFVLCPHGGSISKEHLPFEIQKELHIKDEPSRPGQNNREEILDALNGNGWDKTKAARKLGISRQTIYRKIEEYKLDRYPR
jgi:two-component system response regulator HydG